MEPSPLAERGGEAVERVEMVGGANGVRVKSPPMVVIVGLFEEERDASMIP